MDNILVLLLETALLAGVIFWAYSRWQRLKPKLVDEASEKRGSVAGDKTTVKAIGVEAVRRLLTRARTLLEQETVLEARLSKGAIEQLEASPEALAAISGLMQKSLEAADICSMVVGKEGIYAYIVVTPNRHDHPNLLRRHAPFSAGWRYHAEIVRASLLASGPFSGMVAILFFLNPDRMESTVLLSCVGPNSMLLPTSLADAQDLKASGVKTLDTSVDFSLAD